MSVAVQNAQRGTSLFDLSGRVALVTGSYRGLGYAIAQGLAEAGATVILNGRDEYAVKQAVEEFRNNGFNAFGLPFDIMKSQEVKNQIRKALDEQGAIDILINNAGIQRRAPLLDVTIDTWSEVIDTNLTGVFLVTREVVPHMVDRGSGKIINICSLMSEVGRPTIAPYTAAKGGVKMLTKAMATEWASHNIQVNGIGPGYFATELNQALLEDESFDRFVKERTPAGRWGDPSELVGVAVLLASRGSDFISGQIVYVDGGILASL